LAEVATFRHTRKPLDPGSVLGERGLGVRALRLWTTAGGRGERMPARSRSKTVLIVEDDPDIREVLEEMIDAGGHAVVTATNGAEGLAALAQVDPPALVLLDLMMPVMSGFAFLEELARRKDRAGDKVLLISANETVERAAQLPGVVGYVKKPFDLDEVLALVEKYLE
jgi:CheY-like chemotaxis protein